MTVTDPEVTRYFMSIHEAVALVIQAGSLARGGEVFLVDMGGPVRIVDLARRMIGLAGLTVRDEENPDGDIEIRYTGLRPGEKLFEELLITSGRAQATGHAKVMQADEPNMETRLLEKFLEQLHSALVERDSLGTRHILLAGADRSGNPQD